jgi:hypothetical protein
LSIGALILLSTSPVFGHHLARGAETLLRGTDRIGELCLVALHLVLAPVHNVFHVLLIAGIAYAAWDRARAWRRMRRALAPVAMTRPAVGDRFWTAAEKACVDPRLLRVVDGLPNPAFTTGWLWPRIYVAQQLAERLSQDELAALLAHEGAHVSRRDPLRLSVLRFFARTLFWIPALTRLADDIADEAEIEADNRAAGDAPLVLASAILSVAAWTAGETRAAAQLSGAVGFTGHDMLDRRIRRLAGEDTPVRTHVTRRSLLSAAAALALVWTSGVLMAHPLPGEPGHPGHAQHGSSPRPNDCTRHEGLAILHVFCPGLPLGSIHHPCPHFA